MYIYISKYTHDIMVKIMTKGKEWINKAVYQMIKICRKHCIKTLSTKYTVYDLFPETFFLISIK